MKIILFTIISVFFLSTNLYSQDNIILKVKIDKYGLESLKDVDNYIFENYHTLSKIQNVKIDTSISKLTFSFSDPIGLSWFLLDSNGNYLAPPYFTTKKFSSVGENVFFIS